MSNYAAVMPELGRIELQDVGEPTPGPREAVVRMEAVGVCGSDTAYYTVGYIGDYVVNGPIILGHECAGQVVAVGAEVTRVQVGDRVAIEPGKPCRDCVECMAGRYHLCPDLVFFATPPYDGSLVQRMAIDERQLFPIPDGMSYEEGALCEPLSVGIWACHRAHLEPGDRVLVTGAPGVGKEVAARVLHGWSGRQNAPFRVISSARMDPETVEIELFGSESDDGAIRVGLLERIGLERRIGRVDRWLVQVARVVNQRATTDENRR